MDSLVNFNTNDNDSLKININELYQKKQIKDINTKNNYNKILSRIHSKIRCASKGIHEVYHCWYIMPEMLIGIPNYDYRDCTAYIIEQLRNNGFIVRYTHPNLLFISWNHWIPDYVRNEYKKKTGILINEYGNKIDVNNEDNISDDKKILTNNNNNNNNNNNILLSKKIKPSKQEYNNISQYKPSGSVVYTEKILKHLDLNN